jgi:RNA polymerase sigma-70 factor (ECF subfamily)
MKPRGPFFDEVRGLYLQDKQALYTYALAIAGEPRAAEDAVHAAFCRVLERSRPKGELRPYVFKCVRNAAIDHRRRERREDPPASLFNGHPGVDPVVRLQVDEALAVLTDDERECVVLKTYGGFTFNEIAELRRVSINTAASWYRRGIERMRALHEEEITND